MHDLDKGLSREYEALRSDIYGNQVQPLIFSHASRVLKGVLDDEMKILRAVLNEGKTRRGTSNAQRRNQDYNCP